VDAADDEAEAICLPLLATCCGLISLAILFGLSGRNYNKIRDPALKETDEILE
jgi:hypothetical protein